MHLVKSGLAEKEGANFISSLAEKLSVYAGCRYFMMHCTGTTQYEILKKEMGDAITYMGCGETVGI